MDIELQADAYEALRDAIEFENLVELYMSLGHSRVMAEIFARVHYS